MPILTQPPSKRSGVTLVELLVVITVMLVMSVAALRLMLPDLEQRRVREAARSVSAYLSRARSLAQSTGQPVGVKFERLPAAPQASLVLSMVVSPPPYAGDTQASRMFVTSNGLANFTTGDVGWLGLVRIGDRVRIGFQGPLREIRVGETMADGVLTADSQPWLLVGTDSVAAPTPPQGAAFQILRQPVRSSEQPLQLSGSAVVDLSTSGVARDEFFTDETTPVMVIFQPNGSVDSVHFGGSSSRPSGPVFLMVGKREKVLPGPFGPSGSNLHDANNLWVAIHPFSGQITTAENLAPDASVIDLGIGLPFARQLAQAGQSLGGR